MWRYDLRHQSQTGMNALARRIVCLVSVASLAGAAASPSFAATVQVRHKEGVGSYLADAQGMTLYLFRKDTPGRPVIGYANGYSERWQPFYAAKIDSGPDVPADAFGTVKRSDGKLQTTYRGTPLFRFAKDNVPGDTNGNGVHDVWFVARPEAPGGSRTSLDENVEKID